MGVVRWQNVHENKKHNTEQSGAKKDPKRHLSCDRRTQHHNPK